MKFQAQLEHYGWKPAINEISLLRTPQSLSNIPKKSEKQTFEESAVKYYIKPPFQHLSIGIHRNPIKNEVAWDQRISTYYGKILAAFMTVIIFLTVLIRLIIPTQNEFSLIIFIIGTIISLGSILYIMYKFYSRLESDDVGTAFIETVMDIESKHFSHKCMKNPCISHHISD